jgi:hypothetical protein
MWGCSVAQVDLDDLVVEVGRVGEHLVVGRRWWATVGRIGDRLPAGGLQVAGHGVVVAEQRGGGADLGAHVADRALPVAEMRSAPGPKYSTMAPVPPLTVRMSATFKMTSLGEDQPLSSPVR